MGSFSFFNRPYPIKNWMLEFSSTLHRNLPRSSLYLHYVHRISPANPEYSDFDVNSNKGDLVYKGVYIAKWLHVFRARTLLAKSEPIFFYWNV